MMRRHLWIAAVLIGAAWVAAYALIADETVRLSLYSSFGLVVLTFLALGVRLHEPEQRRPWFVLMAGMGLLTIGDIGWFTFGITGTETPFPSVLDIAYLAGYVVIAAGVILLFRGRLPGGDHGSLVDALILACAAGILVWIFLMSPYLGDESLDTFGVAIAMAYPLMDVLLVGVVARVLLAPRPGGPAFPLLLAFLGLFAVNDFIYGFTILDGTYEVGPLDLGWIAGAFCLAAAGAHPSMRSLAAPAPQGEPRLGPARLAMLGSACLLAPAAFALQQLRGQEADLGVVMGGWLVLFLLVLVRLTLTVNTLRMTLRQRRRLEQELEFRALHDGLTGLANRQLFGEQLEGALRTGARSVGVLFIDLDDFKAVNDTLGHHAGDDLLVAVSSRIRSAIRPTDLAARLGGDEFAILLGDVATEADAHRVAERVLESLRRPIDVHGRDHAVRASIGVAVGGLGDYDAPELMRNADITMYLAKSQGKHQVEVFRPTLHADVVHRLGLRADLERAVEQHEFVLHYQPIIRLVDGEMTGVEALVRWNHPSRGVLAPGEFIGMAESTGLIIPLGRWILDEAVRQATDWGRTHESLVLSVNLSALQLESASIVDDVRAALTRHGLPAHRLVLEVTEGSDLDRSAIAAAVDGLRALGVQIAIDDFGTGYSSFGCLARLAVDQLKIDRKFVEAIATDRREGVLGAAMVQLSATLGLATVAEGIETAEQLVRLRELGVSHGQGFLLARPMPAEALGEQIAAREGAPAPMPTSGARSRAGLRWSNA
jgi:diguanylate cyclase (GGDEF)-like protein